MLTILKKSLVCATLLGASAGGFAQAPAQPADAPPLELQVMNSGGFTAAYKLLAPGYEAATGNRLTITYGPSMGATPEAIPNRLARGEPADVVIMVGSALDKLIAQGRVDPASRVELADSRIGMVVREGAPTPDITTPDALKATLLRAPSIAYSDSASGVYVRDVLFARLGIDAQMRAKAAMIPGIPAASKVADGTYALGLQQVSELLPVKGAHFVGKLPESLQLVTRFAGGVPVNARHPREARALLDYLASPEAAADVARTGLEPVTPH